MFSRRPVRILFQAYDCFPALFRFLKLTRMCTPLHELDSRQDYNARREVKLLDQSNVILLTVVSVKVIRLAAVSYRDVFVLANIWLIENFWPVRGLT
jgi:hypothetical protein